MICDRFDTLVIPFPFAEIPILKRRPVAVLSGKRFNAANGATLCAMITTAKTTSWLSVYAIRDLKAAGLEVACILRFRLTTIPNELILRHLGRLAAIDRLACELAFAEMIAG